MRPGSLLVARALARSSWRHRLRAVAAVLGVAIGVALAAGVATVSEAIVSGIQGGLAVDAVRADTVALSRSANGMDAEVAARLREAAGGAESVAVVRADTRPTSDEDAVLAVLGTTAGAEGLAEGVTVEGAVAAPRPGTDGLLLGAAWAEDRGLARGDVVSLVAAGGAKEWTVTGILDGPLPNQGAIAVGALDEVGRAFGRTGMVDAIYFRLGAREGTAELEARLRSAGGGAVTVGPPDVVAAPEVGSVDLVRQIFALTTLVGLAIASTVVYVCWRLLVEDERPAISRLRLAGAGTRDLAVGSAAVFAGLTLLAAAAGIPLALVLARLLGAASSSVVRLGGLAGVVEPRLTAGSVTIGLLAALGTTVLAWVAGLRTLVRVPPIEAIRGAPTSRAGRLPVPALLAGGLAASLVVAFGSRAAGLPVALGSLALAFGAVVLLALALPAIVGRAIARGEGFVALSVGREYGSGSRGRAAMVTVFGVATMLAVTLAGLAASVESGLRSNFAGWTDFDLFALGGEPGVSLRDERLAADAPERIAGIDGVARVSPYATSAMRLGGDQVPFWAWEPEVAGDGRFFDVEDGMRGAEMWSALSGGAIGVTTNLAVQRDIEVGDVMALPSLHGTARHRVVTIVNDYESQNGAVLGSIDTLRELIGEVRVDNVGIRLERGASPATVTAAIENELAEYPNLAVLTRSELRSILMGLVGQAVDVLHLLAVTCFVLALLVAATTAAASLAARRSTFALTRVVGASKAVVRVQLLAELTLVAVLAWVVAVPLGVLSVRSALHALGAQSGLEPPTHIPIDVTAAMLPAAVVAVLLAAWVPTRTLLRGSLVEAIRDE